MRYPAAGVDVALRASSKLSRGVERSETHGLLASPLVVSR